MNNIKIEYFEDECALNCAFENFNFVGEPGIADDYDFMRSILEGEVLDEFLLSFSNNFEGWIKRIERDEKVYLFWGNGYGFPVIMIEKETKEKNGNE